MADEHVAPGKHREMQLVGDDGRKLFDEARKQTFLEWFAATCNVKMSAGRAGVAYQTVFKHRMKDRAFAEAWDLALEQGYARIRAKLIETRGQPIEVEGDLDAPELDHLTQAEMLAVLGQHRRTAEGRPSAFGQARKQGRRPRVATNEEVREALLKALVAFGKRVNAERRANGG